MLLQFIIIKLNNFDIKSIIIKKRSLSSGEATSSIRWLWVRHLSPSFQTHRFIKFYWAVFLFCVCEPYSAQNNEISRRIIRVSYSSSAMKRRVSTSISLTSMEFRFQSMLNRPPWILVLEFCLFFTQTETLLLNDSSSYRFL